MQPTSRRIVELSVFSVVIALTLLSTEAKSDPVVQAVALSNTPSGTTWGDFRSFPLSSAINSAGHVAFSSYSGDTYQRVNWKWTPAGYEYIAGSGAPAPGSDGTSYSSFMSSSTLSDTGRTSLISNCPLGINQNRFCLDAGQPSTMSRVASSGDEAAGVPGVRFGNFFGLNTTLVGPPAMNAFGRIAFATEQYQQPLVFDLWSELNGVMTLVARDFGAAPGTTTGIYFYGLSGYGTEPYTDSNPQFNDLGDVAFRARIDGPGTDDSNRFGLWAQRSGTLELVARGGQSAPGTPVGTNFLNFLEPGFNNHAAVAFRATLSGSGVTAQNDKGLWLDQPGSPHLVARAGDASPETSGALFADFSRPLVNGNNVVAFSGRLAGASVTTENDSGAWVENAGLLQLIAREGDAAPGIDALFGETLEIYAMNAIGQTILESTLMGAMVTPANDHALWVHDQSGDLRLVLREGDTVEVQPGDFRIVSGYVLTFLRSGGQDGKKEILNDAGQLVLTLAFTDGSSGIFITTVPEPSSLALSWFVIALWTRRRRGVRPNF